MTRAPAIGRPLLVTGDPTVLDELLRVAATAGVEVDVAPDAGAARRSWPTASVVVIGPDLAGECARARLPRRSGVVLIGADLDDAGIWQVAVEVGAEHVVFLPDAEGWLGESLAEAVEPTSAAGTVVGVVGGRGGAGATTLAVALAVCGSTRGVTTMLVDGDPLGGGVDLVFGAERVHGMRWPELAATRGRVPGAALLDALPRMHGLPVLSWDRGDPTELPVDAVRAVLDAGRRSADLVVVDLARHGNEAGRALVAALDVVLLVVPCEVRAAAAAARVAVVLGRDCPDVRLVVRGPAPARLEPGDLAAALALPLAGAARAQPGLHRALERGEPPGAVRGPLAVLASSLLDDLLPVRRAA